MKAAKKKTGKTPVIRNANVLLYDVETSPNLAWIWGKYEQNALGEFVKERQIISFAYKWLGEKEVYVLSLRKFKGYKSNPDDNRALVKRLHEVMRRADVVIGHNVDRFDDRRVNTEFIKHGLLPPRAHKTVDTLKVARKYFDFNSNKLDDLGRVLRVGRKVKHWGFDLWARCMRGDMEAWAKLEEYNAGDVTLLEAVYKRLLPWIKNHPDLNALDRRIGCPKCKAPGTKLQRRGWEIAGSGRRRRYQCMGCGGWTRGRLTTEDGVKAERYSS